MCVERQTVLNRACCETDEYFSSRTLIISIYLKRSMKELSKQDSPSEPEPRVWSSKRWARPHDLIVKFAASPLGLTAFDPLSFIGAWKQMPLRLSGYCAQKPAPLCCAAITLRCVNFKSRRFYLQEETKMFRLQQRSDVEEERWLNLLECVYLSTWKKWEMSLHSLAAFINNHPLLCCLREKIIITVIITKVIPCEVWGLWTNWSRQSQNDWSRNLSVWFY